MRTSGGSHFKVSDAVIRRVRPEDRDNGLWDMYPAHVLPEERNATLIEKLNADKNQILVADVNINGRVQGTALLVQVAATKSR